MIKLENQKITPIHFIPKFCSQCGHPLEKKFIEAESCERLFCFNCKTISYLNPKIVAGVIAKKDEKIFLLRRGIEPQKGAWTYPAGFVELGESVVEGAARETKEEIGLDVRVGQAIGVYSYSDAGVVVVVYRAEVIGGELHTCLETSEVKQFSISEIPWDQLAFRSTHDALNDWLKLEKEIE
ncbi:MAG: NUDIX hydrolase [Elusimicrobia bacterium]|nr:NUDIX hydrolase [Elusimicrobiota bacterium]